MNIETKMRNFVKLLHFLVCKFTVPFDAFFERGPPCGRTTRLFVREVSAIPVVFSVAPEEIRDSNILCTFLNGVFVRFAFPLSAS